VGPTAVGKSAVVEALAATTPIAVVSADSRQIYRQLDIGTAKPAPETVRGIPHFGIDVVDVGDSYSAGRFARDAAVWLSTLPANRGALVVGGTGLYVRALIDGLFEEPPMSAEARRRIRRWASRRSDLSRWAVRLDPGFQQGPARRAARVVEVALLTGRSLSYWQGVRSHSVIPNAQIIYLQVPRPLLHKRIADRVASMLARGWVGEVEGLLASGTPRDATGLDAVGYREIVRMLAGELREAELHETIVRSTRRYAKRQETWFRHQLGSNVITLDGTKPPEALAEHIADIWLKDITPCVSA
jgi:tRNA dimethylallyltransferase